MFKNAVISSVCDFDQIMCITYICIGRWEIKGLTERTHVL